MFLFGYSSFVQNAAAAIELRAKRVAFPLPTRQRGGTEPEQPQDHVESELAADNGSRQAVIRLDSPTRNQRLVSRARASPSRNSSFRGLLPP